MSRTNVLGKTTANRVFIANETRMQAFVSGGALVVPGGLGWRRTRLSKRKDMIDHSALAEKYRLAKATKSATYRKAAEQGQTATRHHLRLVVQGRGGSKSKRRKTTARALRQACVALHLAGAGGDAATRAMALAAYSKAAHLSVSETLTLARQSKLQETKKRNLEQAHLTDKLVEYKRSFGEDLVATIKNVMPDLRGGPMEADASNHSVVRLLPPSASDISESVGWASEHSHFSRLATRLETHWGMLHQTIMNDGCQPCHKPADRPAKRHVWGRCLCTEEGKTIERKMKTILAYMKVICPVHSDERSDLSSGMLVVRLKGHFKSYEEIVSGSAENEVDLWYHIGHMSFNPYDPMFLQVNPVADPGETEANPRRVYVETTHRYCNLTQVFEHFATVDLISAQWYRPEQAERPIAQFEPRVAPVVQFPGFATAERFWPTQCRRAAADGERGQRPEEHAEQEPASGDDSDEDEAILLEPPDGEADIVPEYNSLLEPLLDQYEIDIAPPDFHDDSDTVVNDDGPPQQSEPLPPTQAPPMAPVQDVDGPPGPKRRRTRQSGERSVMLSNGIITYYASNGAFEARCFCHWENRCTLARRSASAPSGSQASGVHRPLGLLAACAGTRQFRYDCRQELERAEGANALLEHEPETAGEGIAREPEVVS